MTNSEMDVLFSSINNQAKSFFENVFTDTYAVDFKSHSNEIECSYKGEFDLQKVVSRSPTGRLTFQKIGSFEIGGATRFDSVSGRSYWVPFIGYTCQDYRMSQKIIDFLIKVQSLRLLCEDLEPKNRTFISRFILGAKHQDYVLAAISAMQSKYTISILSCHTSMSGTIFKTGITLKDCLDRTFVVHFEHEMPYSLKETSTFELIYNAFVFLTSTGSGTEVGASAIVIEKDKYNLGSFEEKFAADMSP